ncbi:CCAAT/enhancer-binding protein zeta-like [Mizuhopecten yessoensis]|uniref:CCAAT/enhancer-binding protein zeta n=1 Tax=Mizuhopecten yessoensis TaxID=6573 RepID=A0A210QU94_MIZYE|nr:CCAAT/enhancer-binding protein zeta-like [Mizuhopecten yessoensis]OWF52318.1 CCAAT/enhancer-binding protein zeta [Mizuhopecten yessoensis]
MASKKKTKKRAPAEEHVDFNLSVIEQLGGDKHDFELLNDVDNEDNESLEGLDNDMDVEPVKKDELREFIKKLGIKAYRNDTIDESEKETKTEDEKTTKEKKEEKNKKKQDGVSSVTPTPQKKERNKYKTLVQHSEVSSSSVVGQPQGLTGHMIMYKPREYLLIRHGQQWQDKEDTLPVLGKGVQGLDHDLENQMEKFASKLLADEVKVHNKQWESKKKSEAGWIKTVLVSGTLSDKIAALTLLVQESPIHCLNSLDSLIAMAKKKGKRECMMAADTLRELFTAHLLPDNRKLRQFNQFDLDAIETTSGGNRDTVDRKLILCWFESQLRNKYKDFINALDMMSKDTIPAAKQKATSTVYELLADKPEQEQLLLSMLVNKLGDPDYKLAAKSTHLLSRLVDKHPNMKVVVVEEVERLLYRPNISQRAQYYAVCFLNQLLLSEEESQLAVRLIRLYFSFFKAFVKKGEVDSKMMSALLTGVNRAYPYAKGEEKFISEQMDTLYKIVHIVNFNTSLQALMLLYQVMDSSQGVSDRYYGALYKKMIDPTLCTSARQAMFLNLLFKSIKKDVAHRRVKAFIKRLLQICPFQSPQFTCAALVLLGEIVKTHPHAILTQHKTMGFDDNNEDDDEDEHFTDLPAPDEDVVVMKHEEPEDVKPVIHSSWIHKSINQGHCQFYDPFVRNPLHCRAEQECMWELEKLATHFHPTVSLFAQTLLKGEPITYGGDPLRDFTTIRFLERFVYKNPKQQQNIPENSGILSKTKRRDPITGAKKLAINSKSYLDQDESEIPVEEKFFHKYFTQKEALSGIKVKKIQDDSDDDGSVCDDDFDVYLDKYEGELEGRDGMTFDFSDVDFAASMGKKPKKKRQQEEEDEDDDFDNLSDEEMDFDNDDDFKAAFADFDEDDVEGSDGDEDDIEGSDGDEDDVEVSDGEEDDMGDDDEDEDNEEEEDYDEEGFNEEDIEFSGDDEFAEPQPMSKKRRGSELLMATSSKRSKGSKGLSSIFASADDFSHLLDETAASKLDMTTSNAVSNKENASEKQLKWEMEREKKMSGREDWRKLKNRSKKPFKQSTQKFKAKSKGTQRFSSKKGTAGRKR